MSHSVYIFTGNQPDAKAVIAEQGGFETVDSAFIAMQRFTAKTAPPVIIVLPGDNSFMRSFETPARKKSDIERAARFVLGDWVSEPADGFHITLLGQDDEGRQGIYVAPKDWVEDWRHAIVQSGLVPHMVTTDILCLAASNDACVIDNQKMVYAVAGEGFVVPGKIAKEILPKLREKLSDGVEAVIMATPEGKALLGDGYDNVKLIDGADIPRILMTQTPQPFMVGQFGPAFDVRAIYQQWRGAIMLAFLAVLAWGGFLIADGVQAKRQAEAITASASEAFLEAYPGTAANNIRREARTRAGQGGKSVGLLELMNRSFHILQAQERVILTGLVYGQDGRLALDLSLPGFDQLEILKSQFQAQGLQVEEGLNPRREGERVIARLYIGGARQ